MVPVLPELISFAAQAFAEAAIGYCGLTALRNWFGEDPEQRLHDIYLRSCEGFFSDDRTVSLNAEEKMRLAYFFGSEKVVEAVSHVLQHGHLEDDPLRSSWEALDGDPQHLQTYVDIFMKWFRQEVLAELPFDQRAATAIVLERIESLGTSRQVLPVGAEHYRIMALAAEERIAEAGSQVARMFEARLDEATKLVKEKRLFQEARQALSRLEEEAAALPDVVASSELMNKLYTNQAVCAQRMDEIEVAQTYAAKALDERPQDPRSLTNRASTGLQAGEEPAQMLTLVRRALEADPDYRQARILEIAIVTDVEGVDAGLELAGQIDWVEEDAAGQAIMSRMKLLSGDVQGAIGAAKRAAQLDPSAELLAWAGLILNGEGLIGGEDLFDIKVKGALEPGQRALEAIPYLEKAIQAFEAEQRPHMAEDLRVSLGRARMALGEYEEASQILADCAASSQRPTTRRAAYANLIEALLVLRKDAVPTATEAVNEFPDDPMLKFGLGRALLSAGDEQAGMDTLYVVLKEPGPDNTTRRHVRLFIARSLIYQHRTAEARSLVEGMETDGSPFVVLTWASLLDEEERTGEASCLVRALASENNEDDGTLLACAEYLRGKRLESDARPLYRRLVELFEVRSTALSDEQIRTWSYAAYQAGDWAKCVEIGSHAVRDRACRLDIGLAKAAALENLQGFEEALKEYEALWAEFPGNEDVARGLTHVCWRLARPEAAIPCLEHLTGIPEPNPHDVMNLATTYALAGDVEASTRTARRALALAPDDQTIVANFIQLMLRNERSDLALEQVHVYLSKFPDDDFIRVWRGEPEELAERFIREIVQPRMKRHQAVVDLYRKYPLPLGMMAKALGRSYVNLWNGLRQRELQQPFSSARGEAFAKSELEAATQQREIVLDESAALTLQLLGLLSAVVARFDRVYVAQATVDDIRDELLIRESPELRVVAATIGLSTKSRVVSPDGDKSASPLADVADALAASEFESLTLALQRGLPLFSDDLGIRDLARGHGCPAFGTRSFLELARREELVDAHLYCKSIVRLIRENYHFISYSGEVLAWAIQSSGYEENDDTRALLAQFLKHDAEVRSYVRVFSNAICRLWRETPQEYEGRRSQWTVRLLDLVAMRGTPPNILGTLYLTVTCLALEAPQHLRTLMFEVFDIWSTQRSIPDDWTAALITRIAIDLADAATEGRQDLDRPRAFVQSISQHWRGRVRRLVREGRHDLYPVLFAD
jgi:tetratricopeptide (TPR) repeat protein